MGSIGSSLKSDQRKDRSEARRRSGSVARAALLVPGVVDMFESSRRAG
jgi:hypothetical protein